MVNAAKTKSQNESCVQIYTMYVIVILGLDLKWFSLVNAAEIGVYRMARDGIFGTRFEVVFDGKHGQNQIPKRVLRSFTRCM